MEGITLPEENVDNEDISVVLNLKEESLQVQDSVSSDLLDSTNQEDSPVQVVL